MFALVQQFLELVLGSLSTEEISRLSRVYSSETSNISWPEIFGFCCVSRPSLLTESTDSMIIENLHSLHL